MSKLTTKIKISLTYKTKLSALENYINANYFLFSDYFYLLKCIIIPKPLRK